MLGKLNITASLLLVAYLATAPQVQAQPRPQGRGGSTPQQLMAPDPMSIYKDAGASAEQIKKIEQLGKHFKEVAETKWPAMQELQKEMQDLSLQPNLNEKAALAKQEQINKINAEMSVEKIKTMVKIRGILTPAQKEKLVALIKEKQATMSGPGGHSAPGGTPRMSVHQMPMPFGQNSAPKK